MLVVHVFVERVKLLDNLLKVLRTQDKKAALRLWSARLWPRPVAVTQQKDGYRFGVKTIPDLLGQLVLRQHIGVCGPHMTECCDEQNRVEWSFHRF